jgi:hypothetical protein
MLRERTHNLVEFCANSHVNVADVGLGRLLDAPQPQPLLKLLRRH